MLIHCVWFFWLHVILSNTLFTILCTLIKVSLKAKYSFAQGAFNLNWEKAWFPSGLEQQQKRWWGVGLVNIHDYVYKTKQLELNKQCARQKACSCAMLDCSCAMPACNCAVGYYFHYNKALFTLSSAACIRMCYIIQVVMQF